MARIQGGFESPNHGHLEDWERWEKKVVHLGWICPSIRPEYQLLTNRRHECRHYSVAFRIFFGIAPRTLMGD